MSDISPVRHAQAALSIQALRAQNVPAGGPAAARGSDSVQLSSHAQLLSKLADVPEIRADLVQGVRRQIDAETYVTEEKIEIATQRLLDELA